MSSKLAVNEKLDMDKSKHAPTRRLSKRQKDFIVNWLDSESETFGNTYKSALKAGFSEYTSRIITSNSHDLEWVKDAKRYLEQYTPAHIISGMQNIATNAKQDRDKLRGLELLAKIQGMFIDRSQSEVSVTFNNSVPRPIIDATSSVSKDYVKDIKHIEAE